MPLTKRQEWLPSGATPQPDEDAGGPAWAGVGFKATASEVAKAMLPERLRNRRLVEGLFQDPAGELFCLLPSKKSFISIVVLVVDSRSEDALLSVCVKQTLKSFLCLFAICIFRRVSVRARGGWLWRRFGCVEQPQHVLQLNEAKSDLHGGL